MAKQKGILRFIGKIGRTVYYYHKHFGYLSRRVTSVDAERIRRDPAFARVRDNNAEFARGAWAVRLIRAAFLPLFKGLADTRMTSRLTRAVLTAIRANALHAPGQRRFEDADLDVLKNFEFNVHTSLSNVHVPQHTTALEYTSGTCMLSIPAVTPRMLRAPKGATHVRFVLGIASVDTETGQYALNTVYAPEMPLKDKGSMPLVMKGELPKRDSSHVFVTLGVEFFQAVNDDLYALSNAHNALTLVYAEATPAKCVRRLKRSMVRTALKLRAAVRRESLLYGRSETATVRGTGFRPDTLTCCAPSGLSMVGVVCLPRPPAWADVLRPFSARHCLFNQAASWRQIPP